MSAPRDQAPAESPPLDAVAGEERAALLLTAGVLSVLTLAKALGSIPVVGTIGFTLAAVVQLYLPLWRCDRVGRPISDVGLHTNAWRRDLTGVLWLCALTFPPYILGHHLYLCHGRATLEALGLVELSAWVPHMRFGPNVPATSAAWLAAGAWFGQMALTHLLGVALPEETFYRGYLQPQLERRWRPVRRVLGTPLGRAALVASALFALGHFLGEWNPLRLGPFFPGLIFAWLRNRSGSVVGAVVYHGLCNILGEVLFSLYRPA